MNDSSFSLIITAGSVLFVVEKFDSFQSIQSLERKLSKKDGSVGNILSEDFNSVIT